MSTRNEPIAEPTARGVDEDGREYDGEEGYDRESTEDDDRSNASDYVVVTGKPVQVTALHRGLRFFSPSLDGVVVRNAEGTLVEDPIASPFVAIPGHLLLSLLFLGLVVAYLIFSLVTFYTRPEKVVYLQSPSSEQGIQRVKVTASCTNPPNCGTLTVYSNYSGLTACAGATSTNSQQVPLLNTVSGIYEAQVVSDLELDLCYVSDFAFSVQESGVPQVPGLVIDFSDINPGLQNLTTDVANLTNKAYGIVTIAAADGSTTSGTKGNAPLNKIVSMDAHQVKTLVIGRTITKKGSKLNIVDDQLVPTAVQYEGKRTSSHGSTLFVRLDAFTIIEKIAKEGTLPEVIANVGGAASVVGTLLLLLAPLVGLFLPGRAVE